MAPDLAEAGGERRDQADDDEQPDDRQRPPDEAARRELVGERDLPFGVALHGLGVSQSRTLGFAAWRGRVRPVPGLFASGRGGRQVRDRVEAPDDLRRANRV